jgi:nicotinamide-nucleotide amidase
MNSVNDLAARLVALLTEKGLHVVTVESCTGGGVANAITNVPGASEVLAQAFVTYSSEAKIALGVDPSVINWFSVYSEETVLAMAEVGLVKALNAGLSLAVTGSLNRVDPHNENSELGVVYLCVLHRDKTDVRKIYVPEETERFLSKDHVIRVILEMTIDLLTD